MSADAKGAFYRGDLNGSVGYTKLIYSQQFLNNTFSCQFLCSTFVPSTRK